MILRCGTSQVVGNTFDCSGYMPTTQLMTSEQSATGFFYAANANSQEIRENRREVYDNTEGFTNVYGIKKKLFTGNMTGTGTITTEEYTIKNFNAMELVFGTGVNTQVVTCKAFETSHKLDERTWAFALSDGTTLTSATITLNSDNTLTYNGTRPLRNIFLYNTEV